MKNTDLDDRAGAGCRSGETVLHPLRRHDFSFCFRRRISLGGVCSLLVARLLLCAIASLVACAIACLGGCSGREASAASPSGVRGGPAAETGGECAGINEILEIEEEDRLFAALLEAELETEPSGAGGGATHAPGRKEFTAPVPARLYLAHIHYLRGDIRAADVYIRSVAEYGGSPSPDQGSARVPGVPAARVLYRFHRARMALAEGSGGDALALVDGEFFSLLSGLLEELPQGSRRRGLFLDIEGEATDIAAALLIREGRFGGAIAAYERLWNRRAAKMRRDRFISYALLLAEHAPEYEREQKQEQESRERMRGESESRDLGRVLRSWCVERRFDPSTAGIFEKLYRAAGMDCHLLLLKAEELEYRRPLLGTVRFRREMEELTEGRTTASAEDYDSAAAAGEGSHEKHAADKGSRDEHVVGQREERAILSAALSLYAEERWKAASERLSLLPSGQEVLERHRFLRYLRGACKLRACAGAREAEERDTPGLLAAELATYSGLEGLYADFASFYRHIWEAALDSPAPEEAVAEAALRAGVGAAPDSPLARRARELLWNLQGLPEEELTPGLPLLPAELEHIAAFVRRGAPPALLEPAVAMLEYRDNVYSLNAELTLRRLIGLPPVRRYLAAARERAEGRLRERLSSILRAHRVAKQPGP